MDVHAHMPGQISVQVPDQGSSKLPPQYGNSLVSQMQNIGAHNMDHDLLVHRRKVQEIIIQSLMRSRNYSSGQWELRVPEIARKLEERIFKNAISKEEYMNITPMKVDQHLQAMMKTAPSNNQQSSHHITSSSAISTMMPTPGMLHSGNTVNSASSLGNSMLNINGATMVQLPIAKGSVGVGNMSSYNASNGSSSNGYQLPPINLGHNSSGNSMMSLGLDISRESSQMIPTPGINNPQLISVNSEYSSGDTTSSLDSTVVSHQPQPKQYFGTQNNHLLHGLEDQRRIGMTSNLQDKASTYGLSNGSLTGGSGLIGNSNILAMSGPDALLDGSTRRASYGISQKSFNQLFDGHHPLQVIPNHGYQVNTATMSDPKTLYNTSASSSVASAVNISQKVNSMSLHQKPKTNHTLVNRHASLQSSQQTSQIQPQMYDSSQHMKFQTTQLSKEHLLRSQNQMQNFQHQQFQQPNQLYGPHHNNSQLNQQIISKTDGSRSSTSSNSGGHFMQEFGIESYNELLISQSDQQFQMPGFQNQYQQKTTTDTNSLSKISQFHSQLSCQTSPQDFQQSLSQQQVIKAHNEFNHLLDASQLKSQMAEQQFHDDFQQRINGQDEAQQSLMSEGCMQPVHVSTTGTVSVAQLSSGTSYGLENPLQQRNYHNQRRWLLFLLHSRRCSAPNGSCLEVHCVQIQKLWLHMQKCKSQPCGYTYCSKSKQLLRHYHSCQMEVCPVCTPVRKFIATHRKSRNHPYTNISVEMQRNKPRETDFIGQNSIVSESIETGDILKASSPKRLKAEHSYPSSMVKTEISRDHLPLPQGCQQADLIADSKPEAVEVKIETLGSGKRHLQNFGNKDDDGSSNLLVGSRDIIEPLVLDETDDNAKQETMIIDKEIEEAKLEAKQDASVPQDDPVVGTKSGKPKIIGVSMTELFTPEQIREHIVSLRQWVGQSKAKAEKNQAMERSMNENSCQLCAVEKLTFEPPPIYCTPCGVRIKRNAVYYTIGSGDTRYYFCIPCYNEARGDTVEVDGSTFLKARLEKKRNDDETEEWWVQCDKCEAWQHQVCALFNGRRNDGGQAEYTCPNCYMAEIKEGERKPLPQNAVLGAKDLPRTVLSDHIEQRLFRRMKHERQERARHLGKSFDEVPGAEALVVRVVSSVDKKLEVKQRFLEMFQEENYPTEFPYKSKVVLLFQRIEGVEVCLFGMYVQEFGSECQYPNHRRVYLSYLDSVKYFRPEIKTVTGEALRTFVYHEILIGYLEYCKKRGFASCYIWACPPLKGEDYILYCHPEIQKTPKSDKLREWYLAMLRKAGKENIVVELTNLYDHFFVTTGECKAKVTAARLPYFDGDYWPGAAEDMINQLRQEEDGRKQLRKGKTKKTITKRALKAAGQSDLSANASKDALLMHKLGETISPMKEDFIMVHLQHSCTHCCLLLVSGTNWICNQCKNFQLCQNCHDAEQRLDMRDRHPINSREKHELFPVPINGVPSDTKDKDEILESEFFDTRQAFLSLCQGNHYQYDTLRRAKHSSMMVLYHLHNPTAPAFVTTCSVCLHDIEAGQSWHCEICNDFDVCYNCYHREGGVDHPHKLSNHPSNSERDAQNKEAREQRVLQLRKMLDLLVHASQCRFPHCQYPNCRKVKGLFRHGIQCKTRASGGCALCKRMWYLLQLHARACKQSECHVPRCKDLKEHLKRSQQQSDSRRRAAVMEMMRQRAAEVQGGTN